MLIAACDAAPRTASEAERSGASPVVVAEPGPVADGHPAGVHNETVTEPQAQTPRKEKQGLKRPGWIDVDHDCQNTRTEVLIAEAKGPLEYTDKRRCKITRGTWRCPYTGNVLHDPHELDVDHMVPLKNAWESGAQSWTDDRWRDYANELEHAEHLIAVTAKANRSKSARGPDAWLPPLAEYRCAYVRDWVAIKARWGLDASSGETQATAHMLNDCASGRVPPLPQRSKPKYPVKQEPTEAIGECCKFCRKGKACGNTCISRDKNCTVVPGCACDA